MIIDTHDSDHTKQDYHESQVNQSGYLTAERDRDPQQKRQLLPMLIQEKLPPQSSKLSAHSQELTAPCRYSLNRRSRKALDTTLMLEKAIAPAARIGFSWRKNSGAHSKGARIPAAMGIRATL